MAAKNRCLGFKSYKKFKVFLSDAGNFAFSTKNLIVSKPFLLKNKRSIVLSRSRRNPVSDETRIPKIPGGNLEILIDF